MTESVPFFAPRRPEEVNTPNVCMVKGIAPGTVMSEQTAISAAPSAVYEISRTEIFFVFSIYASQN